MDWGLSLGLRIDSDKVNWAGDPAAVANEVLLSYYDLTLDTEVVEGGQLGLFGLEENIATVRMS